MGEDLVRGLFRPYFNRLETYGLTFFVWLAFTLDSAEIVLMFVPVAVLSHVITERMKAVALPNPPEQP